MVRIIDADSIPWLVEGVGEIPVITKEEIDQMPEAIIRCKDCKNYCEWENGTGSCNRSNNGYNWFGVDSTDFCSFAERKEE